MNADSVEVGVPSRGGAVKVYFDSSNPTEAIIKIDNAMKIRAYAQKEYDRSNGSV